MSGGEKAGECLGTLLERAVRLVVIRMNLDANTLFLVTIYVEAILGLLLIFSLVQNSGTHAVGWWGCAHLMLALSLVLFGTQGLLPDLIAVDLAHVTLLLAFGVAWNGARIFDRRKPLFLWLAAGPALWVASARLPVDKSTIDGLASESTNPQSTTMP